MQRAETQREGEPVDRALERRRQLLVHEGERRPGVVEDVRALVGAEHVVDRNVQRADQLGREPGDRIPVAVESESRDAVAGADSESL